MHRLNLLACASLAFATSLPVFARVGSVRDMKEFQEYCYRNRYGRENDRIENPGVGTTLYVPTHVLEAGQTRFSLLRMSEKLRKATKGKDNRSSDGKKNKGAFFDNITMQWKFAFDTDHPAEPFSGRSLYMAKNKIDGVFYRGRVYIVDGHHRALSSTFRGALTTPAKIIADFSDLSERDFIEKMRSDEHHFAHWRDYRGQNEDPVDLCQMVNDPNLLLARKLTRRIDVSRGGGGVIIDDINSTDDRIFLNVRKEIPFDEFSLARALRKAINITELGIIGPDIEFAPGELRGYIEQLEPHLERRSIDPPLRTYQGKPLDSFDAISLAYDPYMFLAKQILSHIEITRYVDESPLVIDEERGAEKFIAVKVNRDIPFFEFEIADALRRHNIVFDERRSEHSLTERERINYLKILKYERDLPNSRLRKILLLDKPSSAGSIDFSDLILNHVKHLGCDRLLDNKAPEED